MDKRKVNGGGAAEDLDERASKRRKLPSDHVDLSRGETPETTTTIGLRLLEQFRKTIDKHGRLISTNFLTLPSKRQLPDYYTVIKMPIAFDTIEAKLNRREFPNLTSLESYFKRMISNAKEYNEKGSEIAEDAERFRKALSNFMVRHNPAYKTPGYVAFPTPIPDTPERMDAPDSDVDADGEPDNEIEIQSASKRQRGRPKSLPNQVRTSSNTPALSEPRYSGINFSGLTFQQAQEKLVEELMNIKEFEDDAFSMFQPFVELPSKLDLPDYYLVIPNPIDLKSFRKRVKGVHGKQAATHISEFKSWAAFEEAASYLWRNAFLYNEDGSDIFVLAKELQSSFKKLFQEAKAVVAEPAGPKIKLKMPEPGPKITLKFGGSRASPADSPAPQPAPQTNGSNGVAANGLSRRNPFGGSHAVPTPLPSLDQLDRARSMSGSVPSPTTSNSGLVKNEDVARNSPALAPNYNSYRGGSQGVSTPGLSGNGMPPPSTPGLQNIYSQGGGYAQSFNHQPPYQPPNPSFDSKWRQPGKTASDAMITNLSLATHPGLNISRHFRMDLPPSPTMAQQSITINLPSTHYYLQIKPTIAASLLERQHKLFVTCGNHRLHAMPTIPGHAVDQRHPLFEARLLPGVNRIEVELIATLPKGAAKPVSGQEVELEKITVFANLMRS
ncbi:Bromodomain-containing protein-like protein [Hyaloscypha variabilis F]|uniref:Bromodomain-containing protein-like protein n=1 Tax=Hyaloscypha variabilis (strain UAMH 11265 / GT02V1 / F) TaxID=1149755 RepID=A0A2J6RI55_HYAVF|nr:Bromodomain-containing protein-like protein [Hyaloscypha variabilis F]